MTAPPIVPSARQRPRVTAGGVQDAAAGGLTAVGLVLLGAPVGLLWARVAPHFLVDLTGGSAGLVDPETRAFVGADAVFGLVTLGAGLACGVVAFVLGRRRGPGVVVGLLVGGLLAAYVAQRTGRQVGRDGFQSAVRAALGDPTAGGTARANVRLRATELLVAWPVGALLGFAALTALRRERP